MNDDFLDDLILVAKAMDAPPKEPSERAKELFEAALARRQPAKVVSDKQMQVLILQLLKAGGRLDGGTIIDKLDDLKVKIALQGEGVIYALLSEMEEDGFIAGAFDAAMARKSYEIQNQGTDFLHRHAADVQTINAPVAAIFAT